MLSSRFAQALRPAVRRYHAKGEHFVQPHMNELPVPSGSWKTGYEAQQRKYNMALIGGLGFTTFSIFVAKTSGLIYFNFSPPKSLD